RSNQAAIEGKYVVLIANYELYDPRFGFLDALRGFKADAHIVDELENLRKTRNKVRAPRIFDVPAKYRIGISARLLVKRQEDLIAPLLWARHQTFSGEEDRARIKAFSSDQF